MCYMTDFIMTDNTSNPDTTTLEQFSAAVTQPDHPYHLLAKELLHAFYQAAAGKGKERHAFVNGIGLRPFTEQPIFKLAQELGADAGIGGLLFQALKKTTESKGLSGTRAAHERHGAIVYLCAANIFDRRGHLACSGD